MNKKLLFVFAFIASLFLPDTLYSQKYWVMFKNKNGTPYTTTSAGAYLSVKSIMRRSYQNIPIDVTDLPVTPSYVSQVDGVAGVTIVARSKWLNGVVISVTNTVALTTINTFSFVQSTNRVNKYKITFPVIEDNSNQVGETERTKNPTAYNYGASLNQAQMIGADCMHNQGFRGQGITIAVMDAGFTDVQNFDIFDSLFMQNRMLGARDFVDGFGDTTVFTEHTHGAMVLSALAGIKSGSVIGTAPKASYWLLRTEDGGNENISEEYNWVRAAEFADSVGADITTTSLGYTTFDVGPPSLNNHTYASLNGKTAPMSIASTMAARKGMIVLNAAGNDGGGSWYYIGVPADADSIITVGSVGATGTKSGFSSHGPTADGRIKPDLCAQGGPAQVCLFGSGCFMGNGTSFATPVLAGGVACLWQAKKFATNMQIINTLKATADSAANPNNRIGWGIPDLCAAQSNSLLSSVAYYEKDQNVKIYPNPFNNSITVSLGDVKNEKLSVNICNVLGQNLYSDTFINVNGPLQLNSVGDLTKGIYFISVSSSEINITKKIVKQ